MYILWKIMNKSRGLIKGIGPEFAVMVVPLSVLPAI